MKKFWVAVVIFILFIIFFSPRTYQNLVYKYHYVDICWGFMPSNNSCIGYWESRGVEGSNNFSPVDYNFSRFMKRNIKDIFGIDMRICVFYLFGDCFPGG